jgi:hypothetical protein
VAADGLREPGGASLLTFEAGDEVTGLAFEFVAFALEPFASAFDELPRSGKGTDVAIQISAREVASLDPAVLFFPVADPFVGERGELALGKLVKGWLVVLES